MGLLPPDILSDHPLNWKRVKPSLFLCSCLAGASRQQRGDRALNLVEEDAGLLGQSCEASSRGQDALRQQFLLSVVQVARD